MNQFKKTKKLMKKNDDFSIESLKPSVSTVGTDVRELAKASSVSFQKVKKEEEVYEEIKNRILDEIYFQEHVLGKLFQITNIYKVKGKYHIEMKMKGRKKQDERLINHINHFFHENPIFLDFLNENMNRKIPLDVQMYYNRDFKPILLVNKRGFHFIDFLSYLHNKNIVLNDFTFMSTNPRKIF